jgi:nucleotidyltransferase AbiEii toxin of type IV toxin-antitoxin system
VIPRDFISEWRAVVPWVQDFQVEQDLVISRALVEIFSHKLLRDALAFRGGTALYKLHLKPAARYSEDIDLVQTRAEPAGPTIEALREILDPWLGKPQWKQTEGRVTFVYRFNSEDTPPIPLRLKVEINTREILWSMVSNRFRSGFHRAGSRGAARSTVMNSTSFCGPSCGRCIIASRGGTCSTWRPRWKNRRSHLTVSSRRFWST